MRKDTAFNQRIQEIFDEVNELSIVDVISSRIEVVNPSSTNADALCPFHDDHNLGSFKISKSKNLYKCFSCDATGNGIRFIAEYDHISYYQAAMKIAFEFGIITDIEYKKLSSGKISKEEISRQYERKEARESKLAELQDDNTLDYVYEIFSRGQILEGEKWKLSAKHMQYLLLRGFTEKQIEEYGFFTMPNRTSKRRLFKEILEMGESLDILAGVPGFFYDSKKNKYDFTYVKGIGIPIRDAKGKIKGIQVRKDTVSKGQARYTWFTSSFADGGVDRENQIYGSSAGSPQAVLYPHEQKYSTMFITEGFFKAVKLTELYGSVSVSVQGVGSRKYIVNTIHSILKRTEKSIKRICIAFDADMCRNYQVLKQTIAMYQEIKENFPRMLITIAQWDEKYGKGIDDVIDADEEKQLATIYGSEFLKAFEKMNAILCKQHSCKENELQRKITSDEVETEFNRIFVPLRLIKKRDK